ncbi:MAG: ATP-dependent RNA helicase DbpA [Campylobacterales bacterium]|nr:ATP-dependent RNA helicase DbpA [Campylobacterales bacterium]
MSSFTTLNLPKSILENLEKLGYTNTTKIQEVSLPYILQGKDLIGQGKTGSGKTAAFGIGILLDLDLENTKTNSLVLCPTRELADQVAQELRKLARFEKNIKILTLCGGSPMKPQISSLSHGAHILVGTVGRVLDHFSKDTLDLSELKNVVLDEADKMLDMGFYEDILKILNKTSKKRQTLLFSATFEEKTKKLAEEILNNPMTVKVDTTHHKDVIKEIFYKSESKEELLIDSLKFHRPKSSIVFVNTKAKSYEVIDLLDEYGFDSILLNGDLEQYKRDEVMIQFSNHSFPILVATDVAARGLDIKNLDLVINYEYPFKEENYTHRIGRTARAGEEGVAISLFHNKEKILDETKLESCDFQLKDKTPITSDLETMCINGGKKAKVRKGDILGTLIKDLKLPNDSIKKIDITDRYSYVALKKSEKLDLQTIKIKGKKFKVWFL